MIMDDEGIPLVDTRRFKFGTHYRMARCNET